MRAINGGIAHFNMLALTARKALKRADLSPNEHLRVAERLLRLTILAFDEVEAAALASELPRVEECRTELRTLVEQYEVVFARPYADGGRVRRTG